MAKTTWLLAITERRLSMSRSNEICIEGKNLKKYYPFKNGKVLKALDDVSIQVKKGEIFGIVGESGCGKSTLGKCLMRLHDVTDGNVIFQGTDITKQNPKKIKDMLQKMQMVFQNPFSSFNPKLKINYSLREPCKLMKMTDAQIDERINELLSYVSLSENELNRFPHELSGGQLQRLAIVRALLLNPEFIVADEPVSALDVSVQAQILNVILDLKEAYEMTMLFISHDMTVVEHICDEVAVMYLGSVVETGTTSVLFNNILHPYTKALISAIPSLDAEKKQRIILQGDIPTAVDIPQGCRFASRCNECMEICKSQAPALVEVEPGHSVACHRYSK